MGARQTPIDRSALRVSLGLYNRPITQRTEIMATPKDKESERRNQEDAACGGDGEEVPIRVVKDEERDTDTAERAEKTAKKRDGKGRFVKQNADAPVSDENANAAKPETPAPEKKPEDSGAADDGKPDSEKLPVYYVGIEDTPFGRLAIVRSDDGTPPIFFLNNRLLDASDFYIVGKLLDSAACVASKYKRKTRTMAALFIGAIVGWIGSVAALLGVILAK